MKGIIWRNVMEFEGLYMVSNTGLVKNSKGKLISQQIQNSGYSIVHLFSNNRRKAKTVHRLVAQSFLTLNDKKIQVNHIDGNKKNNSVENLEWCTPCENLRHSVKNGLFKTYQRTPEQKENIRQVMIKATRGIPKSKDHCESMSRVRKGIAPKCITDRNRKDFVKIKCVETGEIFPTMKDAGFSIGLDKNRMRRHILFGAKYKEITKTYIRI